MKLFATYAAVLLLLCAPLLGQNVFTWTPTPTLIDNTNYCVNHNCLTPIGGSPALALSEIKAGPDRTVYGLTGAHRFIPIRSPPAGCLRPPPCRLREETRSPIFRWGSPRRCSRLTMPRGMSTS